MPIFVNPFLVFPPAGGGGGGGGGTPAAPAAPTGLSSVDGNGTVTMSWTASSGADTYTLKRGTASGGPYGTTVSSGITGTSYVDNTVVNGTVYYYVVTATNAGGTSANSTQDAASPTAPAAVVSITNQSIEQYTVGYAVATAGYRLNTNGNAESRQQSTYAVLEAWKLSGASSDYSAYVTYTGTAPSGSATSSELPLSSNQEWYIAAPTGDAYDCVLTVQIRNATTHAVLDTATISLSSIHDPPDW